RGESILRKKCNIPINLNEIKIFETDNKEIKILDKKTQILRSINDYLKEIGITKYKEYIIMFLKNRKEKVILKKFSLYLDPETEYLKMPEKEEIYFSNEVEKEISKRFQKSYEIEEGMKELKEILKLLTPKQKLDFCLILGIPLTNILKEIYTKSMNKIYISLYGQSRTGKTTLALLGLQYWWGTSYFESGDSIESGFRLNVLLNSTNLPILIDDADKIKSSIVNRIKDSAMRIPTFRGKNNLKTEIYESKATLILTSNPNILAEKTNRDIQALKNRFWLNYYDTKDTIKTFKNLESIIKTRGFVFYLLDKVKAKELWDLYYNFLEKTNGNEIKAILLFTFTILKNYYNITDDDIKDVEVEREETEELERQYSWLKRDAERSMNETDFESRKLKDLIYIREEDNDKYIVVTTDYLSYINSEIRHPLHKRYFTLNDFKILNPLFEKSKKEIVNKTVRENEKVFRAVLIPYKEIEEEENKVYIELGEVLKEVFQISSDTTKEKEIKDNVKEEVEKGEVMDKRECVKKILTEEWHTTII
ncbi:MAG: hypothetical protein ACP5F8_03655, partial [Candidatus Aenigmatarchaeota archaeon]